MGNGTLLIPKRRIEEAKTVRDKLDSLIETAEIMNNKTLKASIRKSEQDIAKGRYTRVESAKELDEFFER